jgi:8-oxo-dGTP pyrophosphatase MutT (NUDIX family)
VAARVIVVDPAGRTLLFRGGDPGRPEEGTWWFTPGGGVEDGESLAEAARREVAEEIGIRAVEVGRPLFVRRVRVEFEGGIFEQVEHFFVARVDFTEVDESGWTEIERRVVVEHRWWTLAALRSTHDTVYPEDLAEVLAGVIDPA